MVIILAEITFLRRVLLDHPMIFLSSTPKMRRRTVTRSTRTVPRMWSETPEKSLVASFGVFRCSTFVAVELASP